MIPYFKFLRYLAIAFWLSLLILAAYIIWVYKLDINQMAFLLENFLKILRANAFGYLLPLIFVVIFVARPLLLIPTIVMSIVAYTVFGPVQGTLVVILAEQLSAASLFLAVRYMAGDSMKKHISKFSDKMRIDVNHEFKRQMAAVMVLRLTSLPFDFVSLVSGASHIRLVPFLLGTFFISVPYVVIFFLTYGSLQAGSWLELGLNLAIFGVFIGIGWVIARRTKIVMPKVKEIQEVEEII
jgi:uncharacterized membrane protein YdjX (TVP38/TMEM64 family)